MSRNFILAVVLSMVGLVVFSYFVFTKGGQQIDTTPEIELKQEEKADVKDLKIEDTEVGEGNEVKNEDTVVIHYKGTLENGTQFDSSYDRGEPFETQIGVGQVIKGWDLGVVGMKPGGKRKLTIPPSLGYGEAGQGDIPPNSTLIFEVELLDIK